VIDQLVGFREEEIRIESENSNYPDEPAPRWSISTTSSAPKLDATAACGLIPPGPSAEFPPRSSARLLPGRNPMSATEAAAKEKIAPCRQKPSTGARRKFCAGAWRNFSPHAAVASSFGAEDVVLIDIAARVRPDIRVFTLDTDFLFAETYELIDQLEKKYGIRVERVKSLLTPERQAELHGPKLWTIDPNKCCELRKVEPLKAKLAELTAWATGIRRDQAPTRANAKKIEWDEKFGLVKMNPLADWTWETYGYIRAHDVPTIRCTNRIIRALAALIARARFSRERIRARDAGQASRKKECGLHAPE